MFAKQGKKGSSRIHSSISSKNISQKSYQPAIIPVNKPDKRFVEIVKDSVKKEDPKIIKNINSIIVEKTDNPIRPDSIAMCDKNKKDIYIIDRTGADPKKIPYLLRHEEDHLFYDNLEKKNPAKIKEYKKNIDTLEPSTEQLKIYHDRLNMWENFMKGYNFLYNGSKPRHVTMKKNIEEIHEFLDNEYYDEFHSETGEVLEHYKRGTKSNEVINDDSIKKAIEFYNILHS